MTAMHDSGERQAFPSGAVRDTAEGKPMFGLICPLWVVQLRLDMLSVWDKTNVKPHGHLMLAEEKLWEFLAARILDDGEAPWALHYYPAAAHLVLAAGGWVSASERLASWLERGGRKYSLRNWEKGIPISRSLDSLFRHLNKARAGLDDEDHLAAALCNHMFIGHFVELWREGRCDPALIDLPVYPRVSVPVPILSDGLRFKVVGETADGGLMLERDSGS